MGKTRKHVWRKRVLALALIAFALAAAWGWWVAREWRPARSEYPNQGALIGEEDGVIDFAALRGAGADFVYLQASGGAERRDRMFAANLDAIRGSALPFGAVHLYDPCIRAERQAANFVTIVPRDAAMLPPVIALRRLASDCNDPIAEAGLESELTTFVNQVENHAGQSVILLLSAEFESRYNVASQMDRNLWLERDFVQPDYGGRPWTLWTANRHWRSDAASGALRWVVVQP